MKILYHHRTASRDGQSTHIEEMIGGLRANGHEVWECAPAVDGGSESGGSSGWVGLLKAHLPKPVYELAEIAYSLVAYRRLSRSIRAKRPDGIYERYNLFLLAGIWAKRRFKLPLILEVNAPMAVERAEYGGLALPWLARRLERFVWRQADYVLPVTQVLAEHLIREGVDPQRIRVIPNAINPAHYVQLPSTSEAKQALGLSGRLVVGFTGFVREWDRLDRIVAWIAKQPVDRNVHLLVIGDGPARAEIEACAARLGVADRLSFTGAVPRARVPALSTAFDVALQTALVPYASPLCLFEYLALSKAIVAPDQPNHHEILAHGINALLYDPEDPQGIERALETLAADAGLREQIARAAHQVVDDKRLTWQQHASRVAELLAALQR